MKYFNSLVIGVNTVSIGKDMKVPSAYKGDLKFEKKKQVFNTVFSKVVQIMIFWILKMTGRKNLSLVTSFFKLTVPYV